MSAFAETLSKRAQMLRDWKLWVERIVAVAKRVIPDTEVYVVGGIVRGDSVGGSDVDVLVISPYVPEKAVEKARIKAMIEEELNLPYYHPLEIHLVTRAEAERYLRRRESHLKIS